MELFYYFNCEKLWNNGRIEFYQQLCENICTKSTLKIILLRKAYHVNGFSIYWMAPNVRMVSDRKCFLSFSHTLSFSSMGMDNRTIRIDCRLAVCVCVFEQWFGIVHKKSIHFVRYLHQNAWDKVIISIVSRIIAKCMKLMAKKEKKNIESNKQ